MTSTQLENTAGAARRRGLLLQQSPVKGVVVLVVQRTEQDAEQLTQVHVVRCLLESETPAVVEVHGKFSGKSLEREREGGRDRERGRKGEREGGKEQGA